MAKIYYYNLITKCYVLHYLCVCLYTFYTETTKLKYCIILYKVFTPINYIFNIN